MAAAPHALWKAEAVYRGYTLIRAFPKTGKTHQIRVHLKHAGMPLAIDALYNPPRSAAHRHLPQQL